MLVAFAIYHDDGSPALGASPAFARYVRADTGAEQPRPAIRELGGGLYAFDVLADDLDPGRVFAVTTGDNPARLAGAAGGPELVAFEVYDAAGAPLPSASPAFDAFDGASAPPIRDLGGGLFAFDWPVEAVEGGGAFVVATGGYPEHVSGAIDGRADVSPPRVGLFSPPPGSPILFDTPLFFEVLEVKGLRHLDIEASFPGQPYRERVLSADGFDARYGASTVAFHEGGARVKIRRSGGWHAAPTLHVEAVDRAGNVSVLL